MDELFRNVLTASFHGSIVILAVLLLRLVLRRAPKKYVCFLWVLVGLRLLMPFELQSSLSLQPQTRQVPAVIQEQVQLLGDPALPVWEAPASDRESAPEPTFSVPAPAAAEPAPVSGETSAAPAAKASLDWKALIPWAWLTVAAAFGIYSLVCYINLKRKVRLAVKIPGGWECECIETAFILGFVRPKIYIPMGMSRQERRYILAHERTHLEKGDHWIKMLGYVALAIHWFNPLVWVSYILLCRDIEMACDERVIRFMEVDERKAYSSALLSCSTNRAHYAACPVAFGEVNVKKRILSVLNYRKPGFWVSLVSVIAIVFVAVCLVTSPKDEPENDVVPDAPVETLSAGETGFASTLSESQIAYTCEQAMNQLLSRDSYSVLLDYGGYSTSSYYGVSVYTASLQKSGENWLYLPQENGSIIAGGGMLMVDGRTASYLGDVWAWEDWDYDPDRILDTFSPAGKTVTFPEGTGVKDSNTVSMAVAWTARGEDYQGFLTYTFREDGTVQSILADYGCQVPEEDGGGEVRYYQELTLGEDTPEQIDSQLRSLAEGTMTQEELETYRLLQDQVTEVPSNKTSYDKDFMLGSGQMGWKFAGGEWFFKFGAEDVTSTGARLVVECSMPYGNGTVSGGTIQAGDTYFLEQLVDGVWTTLPVKGDFKTIAPQTLGTGGSQTINWEDNYGSLPGGFYRIGNYYTFTYGNGEVDTQVCYAKFRLYDAEFKTLLEQCRQAFVDLMYGEYSHIYSIEWNTELMDMEYYMTEEVWKNGGDYLMDVRYVNREDPSVLTGHTGGMWRDGITYNLKWTGDTVASPISQWNTNTYMDLTNFQLWSFNYEWYDGEVEDVFQDGDKIIIQSVYDFSDQYEAEQLVMSFDADGKLVGVRKLYLPTRNCAEKDKVVEAELAVIADSREDIASVINGIDLTATPGFDYAEETAILERQQASTRTKNFINTTAVTMADTQAVIDRAIRDCTLPAVADMEPGTNMAKAFYDSEARMWKVEFTASWDSSIYQAVYMDSRGITVMTTMARAVE